MWYICCVFFLVYLVNFTATHTPMLCVNPNPWEGNPYNKPKPLGKINHSKPKIFPSNQTETHTQKTKPFLHFATVAITTNSKKPILSLSWRRPSTPFPSLPIHLFAGQPIHRKPKPLHFSQKPNTANPYTATHTHFSHSMLFLTEIGFTVFFFYRNQTKHFVWFLWKKHSKPMLCFSFCLIEHICFQFPSIFSSSSPFLQLLLF